MNFAAVVRAQDVELPFALHLCSSLGLIDRRCRITLSCEKRQRHKAACVIYQQQEVVVLAGCRRRDGAAEVAVDEVQDVVLALVCLGWEWSVAMLHRDAGVTELLHVF